MRLCSPHIRVSVEPTYFTFDGRPLTALPGETIAAALAAAGVVAFRRTAAGAQRGLWCGMGACHDCIVTVDGRGGQRACLVKVQKGMVVESAHAPLAPLAPLAAASDAAEEIVCDVLVVGAGPAGLAAAITARRAGAAVLVLDERDMPGGQYFKPLAMSHIATRLDRQFRAGKALRAEAEATGVTIMTGAVVWGVFAPDEIAVLHEGRNRVIRPRRLILAPGAHEQPVPIPGWTLPGVMTTGALQTLARVYRVVPASTVVIAGSGPLNLQLACELVAGGVRVAAVVEAAPQPKLAAWREVLSLVTTMPDLAYEGLRYLFRLKSAGVPILWGAQLLACEGEDRFAALRIRTAGGERRITADIAALNLGFLPETALARALGCAHRFVDEGLGRLETETDAEGRTSIPTVFAVGDGAMFEGAGVALARGRLAGAAAARDLGFCVSDSAATLRMLKRAQAFQSALWRVFAPPLFNVATLPDKTIICRCEDVTLGALRRARSEGATSLAALKRATRAGMGRCQGRMCTPTVARLVGARCEADFLAPRPPVRPAPVVTLARNRDAEAKPCILEPPPLSPPARRRTCMHDVEVLIVGGGVIGLCIARALALDGRDVLVVDQAVPSQGGSTANAGSLHAQLHAYDAKIDPDGASPLLALVPLAQRAIALWREIAPQAAIRTEGGLMVAETSAQFAWLRTKVALERSWGLASELLGPAELRDAAPWLGEGFAGAAYCPVEGQMDPLAGMVALLRAVCSSGARVLGGAAVVALQRERSAFLATTAAGEVRAGRVINAAGPWSGRIAGMLGLSLPVRGTVQQVLVTEAAPLMLRHLVLHAGRRLSLKQTEKGHLLVGGAWPGTFDCTRGVTLARRTSIEGNLAVARDVFPALDRLHLIRAWTGLNVHLDGPPQIGEDRRCPGLFHAVTFNGWTLAPVVGELIADAIAGRSTPPSAFQPGGHL